MSAQPFYTVNDPARPLAVLGTRVNCQAYQLWDSIDRNDEEDADLSLAAIAADLGVTESWAEQNLESLDVLHQLPQLRAVQESLFHLDFHRLRAIYRGLLPADEAMFPEIDQLLAEFLSPTREHQELPSAYQIGEKVKNILNELDEKISTKQKSTHDNPVVSTRIHEDGTGELSARYSGEIIAEVDQLIRRQADATGVSQAQALLDLIRSTNEVKVVLNIYSPDGVPDAPVYVPGVGWLDAKASECLRTRVTTVRRLDEYRDYVSYSYVAPPGLRAFLIGRDGTCRYPGCRVPATRCQVDHRVDFRDGGLTSAANCAMFCQHHHNMKTDGVFTYELDPDTAEITIFFLDGTVVTTKPAGPISPAGANWVQKVGRRRQRRRDRARSEAKRQKRHEEAARKAERAGGKPGDVQAHGGGDRAGPEPPSGLPPWGVAGGDDPPF